MAVIGVAMSERFEPRTELPPSEIVCPVVRDALADAGVTKGNLPKSGTYVAPPVDVVTYFTSKWKTEGLIK